MKPLMTFIFLLSIFFGKAQNDALFEQGKAQYKAENYQEAISNWMKILESGEHSSALYFNLGNAHYKLNNIGPSIYYYEKALQLSPNDAEIANNLAFANNATIDVIEPLPKTIFAKWDAKVASLLTFDGWAWLSVISVLLFTILFLSYYYSHYSTRKRILFVCSILMIFIFASSMVMSFRLYEKRMNDRPAIIFAESSDIKNEPNMGSETAFVLHEGTKVQIISADEDWLRIQIADGKEGWIPASELKEL